MSDAAGRPDEQPTGEWQAASTTVGLSRITVAAPRGRVDLSVPVDSHLAELLPILLRFAGEQLTDAATAAAGWVLARVGEPPLDPSRTMAALGVRDGEVLHLRPRPAAAPPVVFDDVLDAVATGSRERSRRWTADTTRVFSLGTAAGMLLLGTAPLVLAGPPWPVPAAVAGIAALLLVVAGGVVSRAFGDATAGRLLGWAALPYAALGGLLASNARHPLGALAAPQVLLACAAVGLAAVLASLTVGDGAPGYLGAATAAGLGGGAAALSALAHLPAAGSAALTLSVTLALTPLLPRLAFRLAGLALPALPPDAAALRNEPGPADGAEVLARASGADDWMTALVAVTAIVTVGGLVPITERGGWDTALGAVAAAVLLLRARLFVGRSQRLWLLLAGLAALTLTAAFPAADAGTGGRLLLVAPAFGIAVTAFVVSLRPADWRPSPVRGRVADIGETILVVALLPLCGAALDLYQHLRTLTG